MKYLFAYLSISVCFQYRLYRLGYGFTEHPIVQAVIYLLGVITFSIFFLTVIEMVMSEGGHDGGKKYCLYYSVGGILALAVFLVCALIASAQKSAGSVYLSGYYLVVTLCVDSAISTFATVIPTRLAREDRDLAQVFK